MGVRRGLSVGNIALSEMAQILSVLLAVSSSLVVDAQAYYPYYPILYPNPYQTYSYAQGFNGVKHVLAGQEYQPKALLETSRQSKSNNLCESIASEKYQDCSRQEGDERVLYNYWSEDIEKKENVSFALPQYTNKVLLVVNLASF